MSGSSPIAISGTLQSNLTTGTLTISNTISGTGTLAVINAGTLLLTGTNASGVLGLNTTINSSSGLLYVGDDATNKGILAIGFSGTGTLNVAGGLVGSGTDMTFGYGANSRGIVNISSGTVSPGYRIYIGGSASTSGEALVGQAEGNATVNVTGGRLGGDIQNVLVIASGTTSQAIVNVSNGGVLGGNSTAYVGITGSGTVTVDNGGAFYGNQTYVGFRANSRGTLTVNAGGTASFGSVLTLCQGTGTAVGATPGGSHATVTVASGGYLQARGLGLVETSTNAANGIVVTRTGTAAMTISGTVLANGVGGGNQTAGYIAVGNGTAGTGTATLTINSGGYLLATGTIYRGPCGVINLNSGGTLQVGGVYNSSQFTSGTIATTGTIGSGTAGYLLGDLNFAGTLKFAQNGSSAYASIFSGSGNVVKTGTGVVTLTGSNSFTGGATLTAGMLSLGSAGALGTTGTLSFNGGAIQYTGSNTTDYSSRFSTADNQQFAVDTNGQNVTLAGNLTNATSSFLKQNSGTATLTGSNSFASIASSGGLSAGVLAGTAASLATSGSANTGTGCEIQLTVSSGSASWAGDLYGTGTFSKLGAGTLTLTGSTTSSAGTMKILGGSVVATTNAVKRAVQNSGSLTFDQTFTGTTSSNISGTGSLAVIGSGTVVLSGASSYTGGTTVSAGATLEGTSSTSIQRDVVNDGKVTFRSNSNIAYSGTMSGTGVLEKQGNGSVTLTGTNTHSGGTLIGAGSIVATTNTIQGAIENNSLLVFDQTFNGTYAGDITGNSSGVVRVPITTTGTVTLTGSNSYGCGTEVNGGTLAGTTVSLQGAIANQSAVVFDQATDGTYAGAMSGIGTLTKLGAGSLILSGSNSYTGNTTVAEGKLLINGLLTSSNFTNVGNLATLGGSGTISQLVTVLSGGTISPGNSPGLLTVGQLDLQAGSTAFMQIVGAGTAAGTAGTDYDQLLITTPGAIRFGGTLDLDFANLQSFADGTSFNLFSYTGAPDVGNFSSVISTGTGTYGGLTFLGDAGVWTATAGSQQLTFTEATGQLQILAAVPEPTTMALLGAAASIGLVLRRRR